MTLTQNSSKQFSEEVRVPSYLCGPDDQLRLDGVARLLQEAAWQHAERLGFAFTEEEISLFWVLHRIRVHFHRPPRWNDLVTVTTWPSGMERLYALREVRIDGDDGEPLVDLSSAWIILDAVRRRPVRPERHLPADRILEERLLSLPTGKTTALPEEIVNAQLAEREWHRVRPSDTDRNRHVNNGRYLQWLYDEAPDILADARKGIASFLSETHVGQTYCVADDPGRGIAEVWTRDAEGALAVACRFNLDGE